MAHVVCEGLYSSTAGVFFALKLASLYGVRYAIAPYAYLWGAFVVTSKLAPVNWGKVMSKFRATVTEYRGAVTHLLANQEAVAALKGADVEHGIIARRHDAVVRGVRENSRISLWHGFVNQLGFHWMLRAFVSAFVFTPHVFFPSVTELGSIDAMATLRGNIGHEFVLFIQSMIAAGLTAKMARQVQKVAGSAGRLNELLVTLREMATARRLEGSSGAVESGDAIEFRDVEIVTPTGNALVQGLSFRLERGSSLLLTGHNGAGKSSIFRCLGGLWRVPTGTILKPGSAESGLHQEVFYLPQRPYNVLGTLYDQITYPETVRTSAMGPDQLRAVLARVQLGYLADRPGVLSKEVNWEEELSLGEKQRLAIARLVYHRPTYAILDECTSAVSGAMERELYAICAEMGVSFITISHRPALRAFHDRMLTIGDGKGGYTLEDIDHSQLDSSQLTRAGAEDGAPLVQAASAAAPAPPADQPLSPSPPMSTLARFLRLVQLGTTRSTGWKAAGIAGTIVAQAAVMVRMASLGSAMMGCIFKQDRTLFVWTLAKTVAVSGLGAVLEQTLLHLQRGIEVDVQQCLGRNLGTRLLANNAFYRVTQFSGRIKDADQRLCDDVQALAKTGSEIFSELLKPVVEMTIFTMRLRALVGAYATGLLLAYVVGGAAVGWPRRCLPGSALTRSTRHRFCGSRCQTFRAWWRARPMRTRASG